MAAFSLVLLLLLYASPIKVAESIGVCYGRNGAGLPSEAEVVALYKSNAIGQMRIYGPDKPVLDALRGSNIDLILDLPKGDDFRSVASDAAAAATWVQNNVKAFSPDVRFKYIAVGNEIHPGDPEAASLLSALQNVRSAVAAAGLPDQIKVSTAIDMTIIANSYPPDQGVFSSDARQYMEPVVKFLADSGSPLLANVYPYFAHKENPDSVPLGYALFQASAGYRSLFDAQVDSIYAALEKSGGGGVGIVVSESGWPSEGAAPATVQNAETYYRNLMQSVKGGTVKKAGGPIETYLFAMFDENRKPGEETEKHFGLFSPSKQPKYRLGFT